MALVRAVEGTCFAVPLTSGFSIGVVARATDWAAFGYFFGPRTSAPPVAPPKLLAAADAALACRFSMQAIRRGRWPLIGALDPFAPADWPVPLLCRFDELQDRYLLVRYDENVLTPVDESLLPAGQSPENFQADDLFGDEAVAASLSASLK